MCSCICTYYFILQLIVAEQLNFPDLSSFKKAKNEDQFPPRFKVRIHRSNHSDTTKALNLNYKICPKSPGKMDRDISLIVIIPGNQPMRTPEPVDNCTGMYM